MDEATVLAVGMQILDSLDEAHAKGLVHRDLKPANLILQHHPDGELQVKVLDFGIARTIDSSLTAAGAAPGTPAYMSPEQCLGKVVHARSNLYSLEVVLYVAVTGQLPFADTDALKLMHKHVSQPVPDPRNLQDVVISQAFGEVLVRTLAKAPQDRFSSAVAMRAALEAVAHGRPLPQDTGEPLPPPPEEPEADAEPVEATPDDGDQSRGAAAWRCPWRAPCAAATRAQWQGRRSTCAGGHCCGGAGVVEVASAGWRASGGAARCGSGRA